MLDRLDEKTSGEEGEAVCGQGMSLVVLRADSTFSRICGKTFLQSVWVVLLLGSISLYSLGGGLQFPLRVSRAAGNFKETDDNLMDELLERAEADAKAQEKEAGSSDETDDE